MNKPDDIHLRIRIFDADPTEDSKENIEKAEVEKTNRLRMCIVVAKSRKPVVEIFSYGPGCRRFHGQEVIIMHHKTFGKEHRDEACNKSDPQDIRQW